MKRTMDLTRAVQLVALDQLENDYITTVTDAIENALDTLRLPDEPPVAGAYPVEGDDELAQAYITVLRNAGPVTDLRATAAALAEHAGDEFIQEHGGR